MNLRQRSILRLVVHTIVSDTITLLIINNDRYETFVDLIPDVVKPSDNLMYV